MADSTLLWSAWFSRFQVRSSGAQSLEFRDVLSGLRRSLPAHAFSSSDTWRQACTYFSEGFCRGGLSSSIRQVGSLPLGPDDALFWQYPCLTEGAAWRNHAELDSAVIQSTDLNLYVGLPWATWIDRSIKATWTSLARREIEGELWRLGIQLRGLRGALEQIGLRLRLHTVCQHIYWQRMMDVWQRLGITDAWLSHCPAEGSCDAHSGSTIAIRPWALYAVNVADPTRGSGLVIGRDPAEKTVLASFMGAHMPHYLSDIRLRLRCLANTPGFEIRLNEQWHFEQAVYGAQVEGHIGPEAAEPSVEQYNRCLSNARFALCPAGAGPNTLRLWEALAIGAVPVLLGHEPRLPEGGTLPAIDWDEIVIHYRDPDLATLPTLLRSFSMDEIRRRQRSGMDAYRLVAAQRCF